VYFAGGPRKAQSLAGAPQWFLLRAIFRSCDGSGWLGSTLDVRTASHQRTAPRLPPILLHVNERRLR
jgi:hypothetical protein